MRDMPPTPCVPMQMAAQDLAEGRVVCIVVNPAGGADVWSAYPSSWVRHMPPAAQAVLAGVRAHEVLGR